MGRLCIVLNLHSRHHLARMLNYADFLLYVGYFVESHRIAKAVQSVTNPDSDIFAKVFVDEVNSDTMLRRFTNKDMVKNI